MSAWILGPEKLNLRLDLWRQKCNLEKKRKRNKRFSITGYLKDSVASSGKAQEKLV